MSVSDSVKNRSFQDVFNGTVRFEIPFFQRGYAWEKRQWDQLFVDIQEQIVDEINDGRQLTDVDTLSQRFVTVYATSPTTILGSVSFHGLYLILRK